jgi:hypothetical protein
MPDAALAGRGVRRIVLSVGPELRGRSRGLDKNDISGFSLCEAHRRGIWFFPGNREIFQENREAIEHERAITESD